MAVGMGVAGFNYFSPNNTFIDHLKVAEITTTNGQQNALGLPTALGTDGNGQPSYTFIVSMPDGRTTPVKFRVITDGDMDFRFDCLGSYGVNLVKEGDDWVFTHTGPPSPEAINYFSVKAIRRAATQRIALVRDDEAALYRAGRIFRPTIVTDLASAHHVRFMNWAGANDPTFNDTQPGSISYATQTDAQGNRVYKNVPIDVQIAFCKEANVNGWFCVHHTITNTQFAALMVKLDALKALGHEVYLEYSNEVWNGGFTAQNLYAFQKASANGYTGNQYLGAVWWTGRRSAELAKLSRGKGYRWVVGAQPADPSQVPVMFAGLESAAGYAYSDFYALTCSHYSAGSLTQAASALAPGQDAIQQQWVADNNYAAAFDNVLNYTGQSSLSVAVVKQINAQNKAHAAGKGLKLVTYEGNLLHLNWAPSLIDRPAYKTFFNAMVSHSLVGAGTTASLLAMQQAGVDEATAFDYDSQPTVTDGGNYGMKYYPSFTAWKQWAADYVSGSGGGETGGGSQTPAPTPTTLFTSDFASVANGTTATSLGLTGYGAEASQFQATIGHLDWVKGSGPAGHSAVGLPATANHSIDFVVQAFDYPEYGLVGFVAGTDADNLVLITPVGGANAGLSGWTLLKIVGGAVVEDAYGYVTTPATAGGIASLRKTGSTLMFYFDGQQYDFGQFTTTLSTSTGRGRAIGAVNGDPATSAALNGPSGTIAGITARFNAGNGGTRWVDNVTIKSL